MVALVLPALLLATFALAMFYVWKRKWRLAVFPALVVLGALPLVPRLIAFGGSEEMKARKISVLTANVHRFRAADYSGIPDSLATAFIQAERPSILLLQEARDNRWKKNLVSHVKKASGLAKRHQLPRKTVATYAADLSFVAEDFNTTNRANGFMVTDVKTPLGTVRVINVHLVSNEITQLAEDLGEDQNAEGTFRRLGAMFKGYGRASRGRADLAERVRAWVEDSPHPVVLGGDFNDVPSSYVYQYLLTERLQDAWVEAGMGLGTTFTGPLPGLRIDYLMVDTSFQVLDVERVDTGFSDHLALRATLAKKRFE